MNVDDRKNLLALGALTFVAAKIHYGSEDAARAIAIAAMPPKRGTRTVIRGDNAPGVGMLQFEAQPQSAIRRAERAAEDVLTRARIAGSIVANQAAAFGRQLRSYWDN